MRKVEKACAVVSRTSRNGLEVLAFTHPSAGKQFVKGTIEPGEPAGQAAERELREESGLTIRSPMVFLGTQAIGADAVPWHFFGYHERGLPDAWTHVTEDDCGHTFAFFWHRIGLPLDRDWHPIFHEAFDFFVSRLQPQGENR